MVAEAEEIISIVSFGRKISSSLLWYANQVHGAPASVKIMGHQVRSTCEVLRSLHSLLERISAQAPDFRGYNEAGLLALHDTVTCCDEVFHELERKFQIACTWITMVEVPDHVVHFHGLERAKWPLREEAMMSLLSRFYSLRQDLQLHLNLLDLVFKLYRENYSSKDDVLEYGLLSAEQQKKLVASLYSTRHTRDPYETLDTIKNHVPNDDMSSSHWNAPETVPVERCPTCQQSPFKNLGFHAFSAHRAQKETKLDQLKLREEEIRQADEEAQKFVKEELKQLYSMAQEIGMSARESGAIVDDLVEEWTIQRTGDGPVIEEGEYQTL